MPTPTLNVSLIPLLLALSLLAGLAASGLALRRGVALHGRLWSAGVVMFSAAMLLIVFRDGLDPLLGILAANVLLLSSYAVIAAGLLSAAGQPLRGTLVLGGLWAAAFAVAYWSGADLFSRVAIISLATIFFSARGGLACIRLVRGGNRNLGLMAGGVLLPANAVFATLRLLVTIGVLPGNALAMNAIAIAIGAVVAISVAAAALVVVLRRPVPPAESVEPAGVPGQWSLSAARFALVAPDGREVKLTGNEYLVMQELLGAGTGPVSREALSGLIGRGGDNPKDRGVDILISRLRRKCFEAGMDLPVTAVRGRGYVFHGEAVAA